MVYTISLHRKFYMLVGCGTF